MLSSRWIGIITLSLMTVIAASPVYAGEPVGLRDALRAAQNTVEVIEAQNALQKAEDALQGWAEARGFSWKIQSPAFSFGEQGFAEQGSWSLQGVRGGVDTLTTKANRNDLIITWQRSLPPDPVPSEELSKESALHNRWTAAENLAAGLYQSLINTYKGYRLAQFDLIRLELSRQQAAQAKVEYERVLALAEIGEATPIAVNRAKAAWLEREAQVKRTEATVAKTLSVFLVGLGLAPDAQLEPVELDALLEQVRAEVARPAPTGIPVEQYLAQNREVVALREEVRLKELALAVAQARSAWKVEVSASVGLNLAKQEPHWKVGLGAITYDLSGGAARSRELAQAERDLELARRRLSEAEHRVAQDYQVALTSLAVEHALLELAVGEFDAAGADYELAERQYAAGIITARDLTKAKLGYEEAKLALAEAWLEYEVQKYKVLAMQGEKPLLALVEGESINER